MGKIKKLITFEILGILIISVSTLLLLNNYQVIYSLYRKLEDSIFVIFPLIIGLAFYLKLYNYLKIRQYFKQICNFAFLVFFTISLYKFVSFNIINRDTNLDKILDYILVLCSIILAFYILINQNKTEIFKKFNVIDIKDFIELDNDELPEIPVFFEENDVSYDLLCRDKIINEIYYSVLNCRNNKRFVISLTGSWGSGKSTILNNVKLKLKDSSNIIVIDKLDVWKYTNEITLFYDLFDYILKSNVDLKLSRRDVSQFYQNSIELLSRKTNVDFSKLINRENNNSIKNIKKIIEDYLEQNDKRIVYIIDNLERTESENIILVLKSIMTILNFNRFVFILSFDDDEIKRILNEKLNINEDYLEKVIQLEYKVPEVNRVHLLSISNKILKKVFKIQGIETSEFDLNEFNNIFCSNISNLRKLKRKINSILNVNLRQNINLNTLDSILINTIRSDDFDLYNSIRNNAKYFISEDRSYYLDELDLMDKYNKEATEFFKGFFENSKYSIYIEVLKYLFPNVKRYFNDRESNEINFIKNPRLLTIEERGERKKSIIERHIYNGKFFESYFNDQNNIFAEFDEKSKLLKNGIQYGKNLDLNYINNLINENLSNYVGEDQRYYLENFSFYVDDINENVLDALKAFFQHADKVKRIPSFVGLNALDYFQIIIARLINNLDKNDFKYFIHFLEGRNIDIGILRGVLYWLDPNREKNTLKNKENFIRIKETYDKLRKIIIKERIDIYKKENYRVNNLHCFYEDGFRLRVNKILNHENILLLIIDVLSLSIGTDGYGYSINVDFLNRVADVKLVDKLINLLINNNKLSDKEDILVNIYLKSKEENNDDRYIYFPYYIDFTNLD